MSILNLDKNQFFRQLRKLGAKETELELVVFYFKTCHLLVENARKEHWLRDDDYGRFVDVMEETENMTAKSIEKFYYIMSAIISTSKQKKVIPATAYESYLFVSEAVHDFFTQLRWRTGGFSRVRAAVA